MARIEILNERTFSAAVEGEEGLVLVDYYADWCGPCRSISPVLEQMADEYEGKVSIYKVDADNSPEITRKFGVRGLPTLMLFKNGEVHDTRMGAQPASILKEWINKAIND
jgi:thioredoxin 1